MLDVPVPRMQQEIANLAAHLPLIAMLVLQARVSKRSVEEIAQFGAGDTSGPWMPVGRGTKSRLWWRK